MSILIALLAGLLVTAAVLLITGKRLLHIILGSSFLSHGIHLVIFSSGDVEPDATPIAPVGTTAIAATAADPLPQALVLTAIVIGFGVLAFVIALSYRTEAIVGTNDVDVLSGKEDH